jgi:dynein heavy chain, axonemal
MPVYPRSEDAPSSNADAKREHLEKLRQQRAEFDTVTVGGGRNEPKREVASAPAPGATGARPSQNAPSNATYKFQITECFAHDVPLMKAPSATRTVKTLVNPNSTSRKVIPLPTAEPQQQQQEAQFDGGVQGGELVTVPEAGEKELVDPDEILMRTIQQATSKRPATTADVAVAPNDDIEICKLRNAEDTVSYFSVHGASSAVKYVYLNQTRHALDFRPYDLSVVLRGHQEMEHYVISSTGVVHIRPGHPSEVVSLSDWMKETAMFNVLRRVRFFKNYLIYKAFIQWKNNIRLKLFNDTRRRLCKKFFLSKSTFAGHTMDLVKTSFDLTTASLLEYEATGKYDYTIDEFNNQQSRQRQKASVDFGTCLERMEAKLTKLTDAIQQRANVPDLNTMESLEQYLLANSVATGKDKKGSRKMKSMLEAKEEQFERMRELKRSMVEYSMLDSYIRLVDYIAAENIFRNALLTVLHFYKTTISHKGSDMKVGFQLLIQPTEDAMIYKPGQPEIEKMYTEMVEDIVQTVNGVIRIMNQKPLKIYFAKTPKLWNIGTEFKRDARVIQTKSDTLSIMKEEFRQANEKMQTYADTRPWFGFIARDWPEIRDQWAGNESTLTCETIAGLYQQLEVATKAFKTLNASHVCHMLWINATKLRSEVEPKVASIREEVNATLRLTAKLRTTRLQTYFKQKIQLLSERPTDLKKFADFVANYNEVLEQQATTESEIAEAEALYDLMEKEQVEITDDLDKQLRERTLGNQQPGSSQRDMFEEARDHADEFRQAQLAARITDLGNEVTRVEEECLGMQQILKGEEFVIHSDTTETALDYLADIEQKLKEIKDRQSQFVRYGKLFNNSSLDWNSLDELNKLFEARKEVWTLLDTYNKKVEYWFDTPLRELDTNAVETETAAMLRRANAVTRLMKEKEYADEVGPHVLAELMKLKQNMPVIQDCGNKNMTAEHWNKIFGQITGGVYTYNEGLNLNILRERDIWSWKEVVGEQSGIATGEWRLTNDIETIKTIWDNVGFETKKYKEDRDIYILDKLEEVIQQLDDHHIQLQTIMASRFVAGIRGKVEEWSTRLRTISDVIEEWITLQKNWMYLEFIFSSDDIKRQLPEESERFDIVDRLFKSITGKANTVKNVLSICTEDRLLQQLRDNNKAIDEIQKKLEDYLETKRVAFPRFYFLSNDELLSILSDVRNPRAVQPHLPKCFDSIAALNFNNEAATEIGGMKSGEGESVTFERVVHPVGNVEQWLSQIELTMKSSLLMHMRDTVDAYPRRVREEWYFEFPSQCIQAVDMIVWTSEVEAAIQSNQLGDYHQQYHKQIIQTVSLVKRELTRLQRTLVCTLIVVDVHNRDVVHNLVANNVKQVTDFEWVQQLKYYWEHDSSSNSLNVGIHHSSANLWYGYEYLGNQPRLVITPLTDRAFLTCTSALAMNLGAAPQGPAGTGKTESVKDLGKALARQVVVFNCSDGINYKTMSRMFAGLAQAGAWACFDEFNRIELEVLSVIAQQMLEIVMALGQKLDQMEFDGHPIRLSKNFGVFITMNPGYAGRTELPDNLKALFRPICMMIPDYALIAEIMFYSEGFSDARTLAQKMVQLYKLSSEQLSKQDHYDFGMRAVKSILVMAGSLKRNNPDESEDMLLIRAMRDSNVPKFLREDTILFMALIKDLFPSVEIQDNVNHTLVEFMTEEMHRRKLQIVDGMVLKTVQLFDTLIVRHGVMMVGQTYCSKTTIVETLQSTLTNLKAADKDPKGNIPLFNKVRTHILNPKSVTMGELYGEVNEMTREWTDGILSNIARGVTREAQQNMDRQWIVFDGPVDAVWIENMNTVLDDNKMLCLFNGERIKLPGTATFMFEVQDLRVASPATVSRCGMVFVEPYYLDGERGWIPVAQSLIAAKAETHPKFRAKRMLELMMNLFPRALDFVRSECKEYIPSVDAQLAVSCIELMSGYIDSLKEPQVFEFEAAAAAADGEGAPASETDIGLSEFKRPPITLKEAKTDEQGLFDMYFVISFIWSVGGNLADSSRVKFSEFVKPLLREICPSQIALDDGKTIYDYVVHRASMKFITWDHIVPDFNYQKDIAYFELFVPTAETTALKSVMSVLTTVQRNILVSGVTGVGKSAVVLDFLSTTLQGDNPNSRYEYFSTVFSAQTRAKDVEDRLDSKLYKVKGNLLGPSPGKKAIFFVDDLNMPALEKYGASPPIELLRQLITHSGFFDKKKVPAAFKEIQDIIFIACCGVPGGGRNDVTRRLTSRFHLICQPTVADVSTRRIFTTILHGFLGQWSSDVRALAPKFVNATKTCYDRIAAEKLPTPAKSHYTFNLRDFGKVVQGVLQVQPKYVPDRDSVVRLFIHEVSRVFHDRLVDDADKRWWWNLLQGVVEEEFDLSWQPSYEGLIFGDYMRRDRGRYEEVADISLLQDKLVEYQGAYNIDFNKETELVFFSDAAHHLSRICRICRQPRGNALLVGVGGSGRQSLTRLAAYVCEMPLFQIAITRSFGVTEFRDNVKEVLLQAGCGNKAVVFLLSDSQIVKEQMLEDINNILNTGEIPNLMLPEDMDKIIESCRPFVKAAGKQETRNVMLAQFVSMCRDNVHIVLSMSPVGDQFRRRLRMFPSLVNCCTIDWFTKWPADALRGVAMRMFGNVQVSEEIKTSLATMCVQIHQDVQDVSAEFFEELRRHNYTTPTSYLELLNSYTKMLDEQSTTVINQINRLQGGLDKLQSTQVLVDQMKIDLKAMQPKLEEAAKSTAEIMITVDREQKESEVVRTQCAAEEEIASGIRKEADGVRLECQVELDKALPILKSAEDALNELKPDDIREVKGFLKPAARVVLVLEAVLVLLGERDLSWDRAKVMMGRIEFIKDLQTYKKDDMAERTIRQLQKYINNPEFKPEEVAKSSKACKSLCSWVIAINNYYDVTKVVIPKKEQLAAAEAKLQVAAAALATAQGKLKVIEEKVAGLRQSMQENIDRKKQLEDDMKLTEKRLDRAEQLMSGLASEQGRWTASIETLKESKVELTGTIMLAAGCVAYLGPFTSPYRIRMMRSWSTKCKELKIPVAQGEFSLSDIGDPVKVRQWGQRGLPMDQFSVENGIISTRSQRWCLCIDPQGQANNWIRAMERDNNLKIIKLSDPNYMRTLENAVKVGLPVLLENIEEQVDAAIDPVLLRQTYRSQGRLLLKLGDTEVDYEPSFRFYMTTKLPNPHYMPELQIKVTIVNFTVTQKGLEDQLLADVVRYEYAELEQRADKTVTDIAEGKGQLKDIEDKILSLLASSTGNILDNEVLINTLGEAKKTSESVTKALEVAEATQKDIVAARNRYRPVATRGSLIYSVISEVSQIDHMYQISLDFFKRLFIQTLKKTEQSSDVDKRVAILLPAVTLNSYNTICRGLFEKDKQLFVFLMVSHIFRDAGEFSPEEWNFFLKGSEGRRLVDPDADRWPEWTSEGAWNELTALTALRGFDDLKNDVWANEDEWQTWATSDTAYNTYPAQLAKLSEWNRLLVLKVFREDLVPYGMTKVVGAYLGKIFTESPAFDLEASYGDSTPTSPIIFVLTTGTDPTATFTEFADKKGFGDRKLMLSLGQDQGAKAQEMIAQASKSGMWVYLQNCHVYASWMPSLERLLEDLMLKDVHKDFRLWLTTMPTAFFPVLVLQSGIKVVKEPPKGLKANIRDSFLLAVNPELWESCPQNANNWKRLLTSLSYFHAIIQERRKFGPLGWNIAYEWNQSDFSASIKSLFTFLSDYEGVPWVALKYMTGVINYGGRVTDFLDSRCLQTILRKFFDPVVTQAGQFNVTADGVYCIPADASGIETVKDYLSNLPPFENPELFGLHSNADITYNRNQSRKQLATILSVQPRSKTGGGMSTDEKVFNIAVEFESRLPADIDKSKGHEDTYRITESGTMISLGTVASQEIDVFNAINNKLKSTLRELQRGIKGEVVMSAQLESMYNAFILGQVPQLWHEGGYLSLKPLASWFEDTLARIEFLRDWNDNGIPTSFWIAGFFFPQGFLTGVLQTHSRNLKIPIDDIKFRTNLTHYQGVDQVEDPPETGVYVHGLFMEGARFNRDTMAIDESMKGELYTKVPVIWLEPVTRSVVTVKPDTYSCPVYKTSSRAGALSTTGLSTNFVLSLDVDAGAKPPDHWILRGVALLCMLDD